MSNFSPVNTTLAPEQHRRNGEDNTPTTPRPNTAPSIPLPPMNRADDATTPTRATFQNNALASQRPLPSKLPSTAPIPEYREPEKTPLHRGNSTYSTQSSASEDVNMDRGSESGKESSGDEGSLNADGTRKPEKKKKTQKFYCEKFPPCNLSFTRSEHLARHIR